MARATARGPFMEESDNDSIATDSTADSNGEGDYNVDGILTEDLDYNGSGETHYLVKWSGYPLHKCTWEPRENITTFSLLQDFEQRKKRIRNGEEQPFDLDKLYDAVTEHEEVKEDRKRRRKAERRRRGFSVSSSDGAYAEDVAEADDLPKRKRQPRLDSDVHGAITPPQRQKRVKASPVKRRGVAQKVTSLRINEDSSSDGEYAETPVRTRVPDSDRDSLFDEGSQPIYSDLEKTAPVTVEPKARPAPLIRPPTSVARPAKSAVPLRSASSSAARKSVPASASAKSTGTAKRTTNIFAGFNNASNQRRERIRVSGETPKDAPDPKFRNLSTQNRFQKYSRNEKAPDISALTMVDPKTGKAEVSRSAPMLTAAVSRKGPEEIHSAFGRRSPPRRERQRSITPPPQASKPPIEAAPSERPMVSSIAPSGRSRTVMCWHWMNGSCRETPETCNYAHYRIDPNEHLPRFTANQQQGSPPPPSNDLAALAFEQGAISAYGRSMYRAKGETTCHFWFRGRCTKNEAECDFDHANTGVYAQRTFEDRLTIAKLKRDCTCRLWKEGRCYRSPEECPFAHQETGVIAGIPEASRRGSMPFAQSPAGVQLNMMSPFSAPAAAARQQYPASATFNQQASEPASAAAATPDHVMHFPSPRDDNRPQHIATMIRIQDAVLQAKSTSSYEAGKAYVSLHMSGYALFERLLCPIQKGVYFRPDRMISAKDVQTYLADSIPHSSDWPAGVVVPKEHSRPAIDRLAECSKLHASGFVYVQDTFTFLVYPARDEEWRFLEGQHVDVPNASLRFRMFPPITGLGWRTIAEEAPVANALHERASTIAGLSLLDLDPDRLLAPDKEGKKVNAVFLAWPLDHEEELQVLVKYFQNLNCKVYHSGAPGAWDYLRKAYRSQVVVVHPSTPLWEIPRLHGVLNGDSTKVFSIGLQLSQDFSAGEGPTYCCRRLLPHGKATLITDDVFLHQPEQASAIICQFIEKTRPKPAGAERDKIVTRPGIKAWLFKLLQERTSERGRTDTCWVQLYYDVCQLCPPDDEDPCDPPNPLPQSHLVSCPPEQMPSFAAISETDPEMATEMIVEWFAGWSILHADQFRRFVVCYQPAKGELVMDEHGRSNVQYPEDPKGWSQRWQHMVVHKPDQALGKVRAPK